MKISEVIQKLQTIQARLRASLPEPLRAYDASVAQSPWSRANILTGPRGVGKTTRLLKFLDEREFLYFSADHPLIAGFSLYELGEAAFGEGLSGLLIDEVHYARDWALHLKGLYDAFPKKVIWASDSSAIVLRKGLGDLSRRFLIKRMPLLSLREFMLLRGSPSELPMIDPFNPDRHVVKKILADHNPLLALRDYIKYGFRPFFLEGHDAYPERLLNVTEKTLTVDIPYLVPQLSENHFRFMNAVIGYLAKASVPTLAVNSLCNEWGIGKEKLYQLLGALELAQVLRIIRLPKDRRLHSIGSKIFLHEPSMYVAWGGDLGTMREAFCTALFQESGHHVAASPDEEKGDFIIDGKLMIEVGGNSKSPKKADFVIRDRVDFPTTNVIPMWMLGFMY